MILYHGTSAEHLQAIQKKGLQPRRVTGRPSNYSGFIESRNEFVYLSTAYAVYFAMAAVPDDSDYDLLIVQCDVDEADLYPDEDFIGRAIAEQTGRGLIESTVKVDPRQWKHVTEASLELNGIACVESVPRENITGFAHIPGKDWEIICATGGDAMPTPVNYKFKGAYYGECLRLLCSKPLASAWEEIRNLDTLWGLG